MPPSVPGLPRVAHLTNDALSTWLHGLPGVDQVGCEARAASLGTLDQAAARPGRSTPRSRMIDLTTLGATTPGQVPRARRRPSSPTPRPDHPRPACGLRVWRHGRHRPRRPVGQRRQGHRRRRHSLPQRPGGDGGQTVRGLACAVAAGADEIDMVIDRGAFLAGESHGSSTRSPGSRRPAAAPAQGHHGDRRELLHL